MIKYTGGQWIDDMVSSKGVRWITMDTNRTSLFHRNSRFSDGERLKKNQRLVVVIFMYNLAKKALDAHEKFCSVAICDRFCDCVTPNTKRLQINFIHILYEYSFIPRHVCSEIFLDPYSFR